MMWKRVVGFMFMPMNESMLKLLGGASAGDGRLGDMLLLR
jgi:hypothetical protein